MIIHKKAITEVDNSWSVILHPLIGELAKSRAVEKLTQCFSISEEESCQFLENTPLLLLEDLSYDTAQKVKDFFKDSGLEIQITHESLQKRKCFKAVWPEEPRLNFVQPAAFPLDFPSAGPKETELHPLETNEKSDISFENVKTPAPEKESILASKYETLSQQHQFLLEEKEIQDKKMETLEKEVRFLRDKENSTSGYLKVMSAEKENLLHELEALRTKNELMVKQSEGQGGPLHKVVTALQEEKKILLQRFEALQEEYNDAEIVWMRKLKSKEDEWRHLQHELQSAYDKIRDLAVRSEEQIREHKNAITEETLLLRHRALKDLVKRQEEIEKEITENEKMLKSVLSEQEHLEKEILRIKQNKSQL